MWRMGEHIHGLHFYNIVFLIEQCQVTSLRGRVAAYVHNSAWSGVKYDLDNVRVHAGTGRIGDNDFRSAMLGDEVIGKNVFHVSGIEECVGDSIYPAVHLGVFYSVFHILNSDNLLSALRHKISNGSGTGVEVVDKLITGKSRKIPGYTV